MNEPVLTRQRAITELIFAGALWGFSFICAKWTLDGTGPFYAVVWRMVLVALIGAPFLLLPRFKGKLGWEQLRLAIWPGVFLGLNFLFQTWGLQYTTATKSSFITVLYVIFVPFIERVILRKSLPPKIFWFAFLGLVGTAFICQYSPLDPSMNSWNFGDLLTLGCSVAGALQIIVIGVVSNRIKSSYVYNIYQSLWGLLLVLIVAPIFETFSVTNTPRGWFGLAFLAIGSTLVAFMLQIRAQKVLSSSLASLLFLLESPFAAVFALIFLAEYLTFYQWCGAALILVASSGAVRASRTTS